MTVQVSRRADKTPKIATFMGTKFATSTQLSHRILEMFQAADWPDLPPHTADWLDLQRNVSKLPEHGRFLVESFPYNGKAHTAIYGFAGRNAQQTLGLLITKRMEELGLDPLGFLATDYATLIWGLEPVSNAATLLDPKKLRQGFDEWLAGNAVMKRTFKASAIISGLIERNSPQARKSGRQATFSSDILYETLLKYDPDHLLMQITREEALRGLVDFGRIEEMFARNGNRFDHIVRDRVTPLATPLMLEVGRIPVAGAAQDRLLAEAAAELMENSGLANIET